MSTYLGTTLLSGVATKTISNAHSLFDFKWSDHILNDVSWLRSDTFSWQDGTVYSDAYNHLVNDISDALISNFNLHIVQDTNNKWLLRLESGSEVVGPSGNTKTLSSSPGLYGSNSNIGEEFYCFTSLGTGTEWVESCLVSEYYVQPTQPVNPAQVAFWYDTANNVIKTTFDGGTQWYGDYSYPLGKYINRGGDSGFNGPEDLLENYNGIQGTTSETVGSYTINYYPASDGHKIVSPSQESIAQNIYNESGVAWYYILDTTNQRFKLPRSSHGEVIEKYQRENDWYRVYSDGWCEQGGFINTTATPTTVTLFKSYTSTNYHIDLTSAYNSNAYPATTNGTINVNSFQVRTPNANVDFYWKTSGYISSVPSNTCHKYMYFYIGDYDVSATAQTAGLNTELFNDKVDINGSNAGFVHIVETYHIGSNYYRIYSDGWCEQGGFVTRTGTTDSVTFHKEFVDTNYNLQMSVRHTAAGTDGRPPLINSPTTTGFTASIYTGYEGFYWKACGYVLMS